MHSIKEIPPEKSTLVLISKKKKKKKHTLDIKVMDLKQVRLFGKIRDFLVLKIHHKIKNNY